MRNLDLIDDDMDFDTAGPTVPGCLFYVGFGVFAILCIIAGILFILSGLNVI